MSTITSSQIAFIGGGNMASAILGGLIRAGHAPSQLWVVEPSAEQRERLRTQLGLEAVPAADERLRDAHMVVWAVKPQLFNEAAAACAGHVAQALQVSVMAGVRCATLAQATGSARVVRSMPNTPALIGRGMTGLYAEPTVSAEERAAVDALLAPTGERMWVAQESDLDAVTAVSGSGPAYFFYFVEAMERAAVQQGLSAAQGRQLALATCAGAAALAQSSDDPPAVLRERVTSKGGTTYAALCSLESEGVGAAIERAVAAAARRARELGAG